MHGRVPPLEQGVVMLGIPTGATVQLSHNLQLTKKRATYICMHSIYGIHVCDSLRTVLPSRCGSGVGTRVRRCQIVMMILVSGLMPSRLRAGVLDGIGDASNLRRVGPVCVPALCRSDDDNGGDGVW